jgi:hypothetical protein
LDQGVAVLLELPNAQSFEAFVAQDHDVICDANTPNDIPLVKGLDELQ